MRHRTKRTRRDSHEGARGARLEFAIRLTNFARRLGREPSANEIASEFGVSKRSGYRWRAALREAGWMPAEP